MQNSSINKNLEEPIMYHDYDKHDVAIYGGYLDDNAKILQSASGGIATALSEFMLQQGGYVAGVAYSEDLYKAEYVIIHNMADIHKLKGSKYIESDKKNIYSEVKELIDSGEKVLFFGLPCIVGALYNYIGSRPENLLTCELICHGPTLPKIHQDYITFLERKNKSKIIEFSVRYKIEAWKPVYLYAKFENGHVFKKPFYETEYGIAFSILPKQSCYNCKFKGNNRQADIMIGDFWGAVETDVFWNKYGVSSIFAETEKGNSFLKSLPGIKLFPTTFERAVEKNPMVITSIKRKNNRDKFAKLLSEKGLIYAVKHTTSYKKRVAKAVLRLVPHRIRPIIKTIARKILLRG